MPENKLSAIKTTFLNNSNFGDGNYIDVGNIQTVAKENIQRQINKFDKQHVETQNVENFYYNLANESSIDKNKMNQKIVEFKEKLIKEYSRDIKNFELIKKRKSYNFHVNSVKKLLMLSDEEQLLKNIIVDSPTESKNYLIKLLTESWAEKDEWISHIDFVFSISLKDLKQKFKNGRFTVFDIIYDKWLCHITSGDESLSRELWIQLTVNPQKILFLIEGENQLENQNILLNLFGNVANYVMILADKVAPKLIYNKKYKFINDGNNNKILVFKNFSENADSRINTFKKKSRSLSPAEKKVIDLIDFSFNLNEEIDEDFYFFNLKEKLDNSEYMLLLFIYFHQSFTKNEVNKINKVVIEGGLLRFKGSKNFKNLLNKINNIFYKEKLIVKSDCNFYSLTLTGKTFVNYFLNYNEQFLKIEKQNKSLDCIKGFLENFIIYINEYTKSQCNISYTNEECSQLYMLRALNTLVSFFTEKPDYLDLLEKNSIILLLKELLAYRQVRHALTFGCRFYELCKNEIDSEENLNLILIYCGALIDAGSYNEAKKILEKIGEKVDLNANNQSVNIKIDFIYQMALLAWKENNVDNLAIYCKKLRSCLNDFNGYDSDCVIEYSNYYQSVARLNILNNNIEKANAAWNASTNILTDYNQENYKQQIALAQTNMDRATLACLTHVNSEQKNFDEAYSLLKASLDIVNKYELPTCSLKVEILKILIILEAYQSNHQKVDEYFEQAISLFKTTFLLNHKVSELQIKAYEKLIDKYNKPEIKTYLKVKLIHTLMISIFGEKHYKTIRTEIDLEKIENIINLTKELKFSITKQLKQIMELTNLNQPPSFFCGDSHYEKLKKAIQKGHIILINSKSGSGGSSLMGFFAHQYINELIQPVIINDKNKLIPIWLINAADEETLYESYTSLAKVLDIGLEKLEQIELPKLIELIKLELAERPGWILIYDKISNYNLIEDIISKELLNGKVVCLVRSEKIKNFLETDETPEIMESLENKFRNRFSISKLNLNNGLPECDAISLLTNAAEINQSLADSIINNKNLAIDMLPATIVALAILTKQAKKIIDEKDISKFFIPKLEQIKSLNQLAVVHLLLDNLSDNDKKLLLFINLANNDEIDKLLVKKFIKKIYPNNTKDENKIQAREYLAKFSASLLIKKHGNKYFIDESLKRNILSIYLEFTSDSSAGCIFTESYIIAAELLYKFQRNFFNKNHENNSKNSKEKAVKKILFYLPENYFEIILKEPYVLLLVIKTYLNDLKLTSIDKEFLQSIDIDNFVLFYSNDFLEKIDNLADLLFEKGEFKAAEALCQSLIFFLKPKKSDPEYFIPLLLAHLKLSNIFRRTANFDDVRAKKSIEVLKNFENDYAFEISKEGNKFRVINFYANLAMAYFSQGEINNAIIVIKKIEKIRKNFKNDLIIQDQDEINKVNNSKNPSLSEKKLQYAHNLAHIGTIYQFSEEPEKALAYHQEAYKLLNDREKSHSRGLAIIHALATYYFFQGNYSEASKKYNEVINKAEKSKYTCFKSVEIVFFSSICDLFESLRNDRENFQKIKMVLYNKLNLLIDKQKKLNIHVPSAVYPALENLCLKWEEYDDLEKFVEYINLLVDFLQTISSDTSPFVNKIQSMHPQLIELVMDYPRISLANSKNNLNKNAVYFNLIIEAYKKLAKSTRIAFRKLLENNQPCTNTDFIEICYKLSMPKDDKAIFNQLVESCCQYFFKKTIYEIRTENISDFIKASEISILLNAIYKNTPTKNKINFPDFKEINETNEIVEKFFNKNSNSKSVCLIGLPKAGKKKFALKYAEKFLDANKEAYCCWIDCRSKEIIKAGLLTILDKFEIKPPSEYNQADVLNSIKKYIQLRGRKCLIVLANAHNDIKNNFEKIAESSVNVKMLITSSINNFISVSPESRIFLGEYVEKDAENYLYNHPHISGSQFTPNCMLAEKAAAIKTLAISYPYPQLLQQIAKTVSYEKNSIEKFVEDHKDLQKFILWIDEKVPWYVDFEKYFEKLANDEIMVLFLIAILDINTITKQQVKDVLLNIPFNTNIKNNLNSIFQNFEDIGFLNFTRTAVSPTVIPKIMKITLVKYLQKKDKNLCIHMISSLIEYFNEKIPDKTSAYEMQDFKQQAYFLLQNINHDCYFSNSYVKLLRKLIKYYKGVKDLNISTKLACLANLVDFKNYVYNQKVEGIKSLNSRQFLNAANYFKNIISFHNKSLKKPGDFYNDFNIQFAKLDAQNLLSLSYLFEYLNPSTYFVCYTPKFFSDLFPSYLSLAADTNNEALKFINLNYLNNMTLETYLINSFIEELKNPNSEKFLESLKLTVKYKESLSSDMRNILYQQLDKFNLFSQQWKAQKMNTALNPEKLISIYNKKCVYYQRLYDNNHLEYAYSFYQYIYVLSKSNFIKYKDKIDDSIRTLKVILQNNNVPLDDPKYKKLNEISQIDNTVTAPIPEAMRKTC